jgi:hypothetical protein
VGYFTVLSLAWPHSAEWKKDDELGEGGKKRKMRSWPNQNTVRHLAGGVEGNHENLRLDSRCPGEDHLFLNTSLKYYRITNPVGTASVERANQHYRHHTALVMFDS